LAFLDGTLRRDRDALARLDTVLPATVPGARLTHLPRAPGCMSLAHLLADIRRQGVQAAGARSAAVAGCDVRATLMDAAEVLRSSGEGARAVEVMRWLTERDREDFFAREGLGEALAAGRQYAEAAAAYRAALALLNKASVSPPRQKQILQHRINARIQLVTELGGR